MNSNARFCRRLWLAVLPTAVLSLTTCFGLPVGAREPGTIHVQLVDVDLRTPGGRQTANQRIRRAARAVCSRVADHQDLGLQIHVAKCIELTIANATQSLQQQIARSEAQRVAQSRVP
jgi:UrcA family protein